MATPLDKLIYDTAQAARVSWFFGQKLLAARFSKPMPMPEHLKGRAVPDRRRILGQLDWKLHVNNRADTEATGDRQVPAL